MSRQRMGMEDLSLDDIIKRKTGKQSFRTNNQGRNTGMKPGFQRRQFNTKQTQRKDVVDARFLIKSKQSQVMDARQKIKPKPVVDAREKLELRKLASETIQEYSETVKIPKVTIKNNLVHEERKHLIPKITFHNTQSTRRQPAGLIRNPDPGYKVSSWMTEGIKIAVKNELAQTRPRQVPSSPPPPMKKSFERLKITTINRDALKQLPPPPPLSPPQTTQAIPRKRSLPMPVQMEVDSPPRVKQRKQMTREQEVPVQPKRMSKPDMSRVRPMISRHDASPRSDSLRDVDDDINLSAPSPIEGTKLKVTNLHQVVTEDDILELFSVLGAVRRARLVKPGEAEVVYIKQDNALTAYKKYNNRDLDGQPMQIKFMTSEPQKPATMYSWMKEVKSSRKKSEPGEVTELHSGVLQQALFKGGSTGTSSRPVVFTVKI